MKTRFLPIAALLPKGLSSIASYNNYIEKTVGILFLENESKQQYVFSKTGKLVKDVTPDAGKKQATAFSATLAHYQTEEEARFKRAIVNRTMNEVVGANHYLFISDVGEVEELVRGWLCIVAFQRLIN